MFVFCQLVTYPVSVLFAELSSKMCKLIPEYERMNDIYAYLPSFCTSLRIACKRIMCYGLSSGLLTILSKCIGNTIINISCKKYYQYKCQYFVVKVLQ